MQVAAFTGMILALLKLLVLYLYYKIEKDRSLAMRLNVTAWLLYLHLNSFPHQNVMAATSLPIWNSPLSLLSLALYSDLIDMNAGCHGQLSPKWGVCTQGVHRWSIGVCEGNGIYFLSEESEKEIKLYQYLIYRLILVPSLSLYVRGSSVTLCMWRVLSKGWVFHNVEGFTVAPLIVHLISAYYYVLQFVCPVK